MKIKISEIDCKTSELVYICCQISKLFDSYLITFYRYKITPKYHPSTHASELKKADHMLKSWELKIPFSITKWWKKSQWSQLSSRQVTA